MDCWCACVCVHWWKCAVVQRLVANSGLIVTLCYHSVLFAVRMPSATGSFSSSFLQILSFKFSLFSEFCFYFQFFFFRFGASSRSRAVKYSWPCCVLKIRLISTPSLFSSSASPLSLPSVDEQQKHVYLARFAKIFSDWTALNNSSSVRLQFDDFLKSPFASISGIKERNSAGKEGLMVKGRKERGRYNEWNWWKIRLALQIVAVF